MTQNRAIHSSAEVPEIPTGIDAPSQVEAVIAQRRSVRAFKPDPVPREIVERILKVSARAPSGTNMQHWRAHVLTGAAKDRLSAAVLKAFDDPEIEGKS